MAGACVQQYFLNVFDVRVKMKIMEISSEVFTRVLGLNLCSKLYAFTAFTTTMNEDGIQSLPVAGQVNFSGRNAIVYLSNAC